MGFLEHPASEFTKSVNMCRNAVDCLCLEKDGEYIFVAEMKGLINCGTHVSGEFVKYLISTFVESLPENRQAPIAFHNCR